MRIQLISNYKIKMGHTSANTVYTAHFVRPNFGFAETSYILGPLGAMQILIFKQEVKL